MEELNRSILSWFRWRSRETMSRLSQTQQIAIVAHRFAAPTGNRRENARKEETKASSLIAGIGVARKSSELRRDFPIERNRRFPSIAALAKDERRERGREAGAAVRRRRAWQGGAARRRWFWWSEQRDQGEG
ncbi:hypothetical protein JCGZ_01401 [Jatropha curcas]|uniref:Uncharacterized protein n=1 Tax=Jatropha curcas TaxID=180498 RepID=A0A067L8X0_JATCU|nr:hypothetical protein JCGZ_01401 [Jatropha curcas]